MSRFKPFRSAFCAALCLLGIGSSCIASEPSKYKQACGEWVLAHVLPGTGVDLFSSLVTQCINIQEYNEKRNKKEQERQQVDSDTAITKALIHAMELATSLELSNKLSKEALTACENERAGKKPTLANIARLEQCYLGHKQVDRPADTAVAASLNPAAFELAFWESVKDSKKPEELKAYLQQYPNGTFARLAEVRLRSLEQVSAVPTQHSTDGMKHSQLPTCSGLIDPATWTNCFGERTFSIGDASGPKYVGEFKNGKYNGQGTFTYPNGREYVGEFRDGKFNGQGTYTTPYGGKYVGEFRNDNYNGQGTDTYRDGGKYVGEFRNGKRDGVGVLYDPNGSVLKSGTWQSNTFVRGN